MYDALYFTMSTFQSHGIISSKKITKYSNKVFRIFKAVTMWRQILDRFAPFSALVSYTHVVS